MQPAKASTDKSARHRRRLIGRTFSSCPPVSASYRPLPMRPRPSISTPTNVHPRQLFQAFSNSPAYAVLRGPSPARAFAASEFLPAVGAQVRSVLDGGYALRRASRPITTAVFVGFVARPVAAALCFLRSRRALPVCRSPSFFNLIFPGEIYLVCFFIHFTLPLFLNPAVYTMAQNEKAPSSEFEVDSQDLHLQSKMRSIRRVDGARVSVTVLALLMGITILGVSADALNVYNTTHVSGDFLLPLWPDDFDLRPTVALVAGAAVVAMANVVSLLCSRVRLVRVVSNP